MAEDVEMTEPKPPTQAVGVSGFDAHQPMRAAPRIPAKPQAWLQQASSDPHFQAWLAAETGAEGPMTPGKTVEAVFAYCGAQSWSDLSLPDQLQRFAELLTRYSASASRT